MKESQIQHKATEISTAHEDQHTLYAVELKPDRTVTSWTHLFLLDTPDNTPEPCSLRKWLKWKHSLDDEGLREYQAAKGLSDEELEQDVDPEHFSTYRANGWVRRGPQGRGFDFLKELRNQLERQGKPNTPQLKDIVFQEFPSILHGWVAVYATSNEALQNLRDVLIKVGNPTQVVAVPCQDGSAE